MVTEKTVKLNNKQKEAINSLSNSIVIIAPAGSGKTTTLIEAVKKYREDYPDNRIVVITFTNNATDEIIKRLGRSAYIKASTIHSWAYTELEKLSKLLYLEDPMNTFKIKLLQQDRIEEILSELASKRNFFRINTGVVYSFIMGNRNMKIPENLRKTFMALERDYIDYKEDYGLYDFTDLPRYLLDKLRDYNKTIDDIDALFVDEFQDVDEQQIEIFKRVTAIKKFFIGDPQQSIYQFRGATSEVMEKLHDFDVLDLDLNYRSYQEIIDFATTYRNNALNFPYLFSGQLESMRSPIKCIRGRGGKVYVLTVAGKAYEVNSFVESGPKTILRRFLDDGAMILCRKNKEVEAIQKFGYKKVQTIHQAKGLEYEKVILTDFEIASEEDINIAYVGMTRAKDELFAANYEEFVKLMKIWQKEGMTLF